MGSYYWIKLYHEILDDPKMGLLPDRLWRRIIELFLMAGELDQEGELPPLCEMAWRLRIPEADLAADLEQIEALCIVHRTDDTWIVTRFADRQARDSDAERQRRYRERKRKTARYGHADDTSSVTDDVTDSVTTRNTDIDIDKTTEGADAPTQTPSTFEQWRDGYRSAEKPNSYAGLMLKTLYPGYYKGTVKPNYGMLGGLLRKYDAEYVLSLIFQNSARPPSGDPIKFVAGIVAKNPERAATRPKQKFVTVGGES